MKVRQVQVEVLAQRSATEFVARLETFLREHFQEVDDTPRDELREEIARQVANAGVYGMETEAQIANYVTCAWLLGPGFDRDVDIVRKVLASPIYSAERKSEWLIKKAHELLEAREAAAP